MKIYKLSSQILPKKLEKELVRSGYSLANIDNSNKRVSFKTGIECCFVQINKNYGIKAFANSFGAEYAYKQQKMSAENGYSPKVIGDLELIMLKIPKSCCRDNDLPVGWGRLWFFKTQVANVDHKKFLKFKKEVNDLVSSFEIIYDIEEYDLHDENIGWIGNKPYIIDCGEMSTSY